MKYFVSEFNRIIRKPFLIIALFAIVCLPLIYGGLYLWSFWDPYGHIDKITVAIVNQDRGGVINAVPENLGNKFVDQLKTNPVMNWVFVDCSQAMAGIQDKTYYAALIIPADLTQKVASIDSDHPQPGRLTLVTRDATNMLATKITDRVFLEIQQNLNRSISEDIVAHIFYQIQDISVALQQGATGAADLNTGLSQLADGGSDLKQGLATLAQGTSDLHSGLSTLSDHSQRLLNGSHDAATASGAINANLAATVVGSQTLTTGLSQIDDNLRQLNHGLSQAASGSATLAVGNQQLYQNLNQAASAAAALNAAAPSLASASASVVQVAGGLTALLNQFQQAHQELASDSGLLAVLSTSQQLTAGSEQLDVNLQQVTVGMANLNQGLQKVTPASAQLSFGLNSLSTQLAFAYQGSQQLVAGTSQTLIGSQSLRVGLGQLSAGATVLTNGTAQLETGIHDYAAGVIQAKTGSQQIKDGTGPLADGAKQLTDNLVIARDGALTLHNQLQAGADELRQQTTDSQIAAKKIVIAQPVDSNQVNYGEVANYGTGFAPYFIPLALWVGSLTIFFIIKPVEITEATPWGTFVLTISKQLASYAVGLLQSALLILALTVGLGLKIKYLGLFILFVALISLTSITIIQSFTAIFNEAAKFISIVLLMLQLTSSAGTFPIETSPRFFQAIAPYLPMTYAVTGLRELISGDNLKLVGSDAMVLSIITGIFFSCTLITKKWWRPTTILESM